MDLQYWEDYYKKHPEAFTPSDFVQTLPKYINPTESIIDLGCGNARDTTVFATLGLDTTGIDQCDEQIDRLNEQYTHLDTLQFKTGDFTHMKCKNVVDHAYSRFTLHSIDENAENRLIQWASKSVQKYFFIETRSDKDKLNGVKTDHYRRFINMNHLLLKLINAGFEIEYAELSRNFSKYDSRYKVDYNEEDPMLIRVVARKL
jgi:SAM-dependent methyltransferase